MRKIHNKQMSTKTSWHNNRTVSLMSVSPCYTWATEIDMPLLQLLQTCHLNLNNPGDPEASHTLHECKRQTRSRERRRRSGDFGVCKVGTTLHGISIGFIYLFIKQSMWKGGPESSLISHTPCSVCSSLPPPGVVVGDLLFLTLHVNAETRKQKPNATPIPSDLAWHNQQSWTKVWMFKNQINTI